MLQNHALCSETGRKNTCSLDCYVALYIIYIYIFIDIFLFCTVLYELLKLELYICYIQYNYRRMHHCLKES